MLRYHTIPVTAFQQNCSIVWCDETKEAAAIDPGGEAARIEETAQKLGVQLKQLWLTHAHIDHVGAAGALAGKLGIPIIGPHEGDKFWLDGLQQQVQAFGFEEKALPFTPTRWLNEGDTLTLGKSSVAVHHTPGHTPGHVIFHAQAEKLAFVGDLLFAGSVGRTDFPGGSWPELEASIKRHLWPLPDDTTFVPGHGPEGTIGHEKRTNPFVGERA